MLHHLIHLQARISVGFFILQLRVRREYQGVRGYFMLFSYALKAIARVVMQDTTLCGKLIVARTLEGMRAVVLL